MDAKQQPIIASVIFCNSASQDEAGKINCRGIFTSFLAWAYPTSLRSWHSIITLYNLPEAGASVSAAISFGLGRGKKTTLASVDVDRDEGDTGNVVDLPLRHKFTREGLYTLHFTVIGTTTVLKVPLKVTSKTWPHFTKKQLEFLKKTPSIPHSVRMNVVCSDCSRPYVFEESVLPNELLADGVLPFPESGDLECESCGHDLNLKDIQGQLRSSIHKAVLRALRRRGS